nr:MAG TPA_asm: hypothetical protein [Caudoviricetes sp.]
MPVSSLEHILISSQNDGENKKNSINCDTLK